MKTNRELMKTQLNTQQLAIDLIAFLQKWGMWRDAIIFTGGEMYSYSYEETDSVSGLYYSKEEPCVSMRLI